MTNICTQAIGSVAADYSSAVYCATMTAEGSESTRYTIGKDDTVNCPSANLGDAALKGQAPPAERTLLRPDDVKVPFHYQRGVDGRTYEPRS